MSYEPPPVISLDHNTYEKLLALADERRWPIAKLGELLDMLINKALDRELVR
jgi:hypothetical protein